MPVERLPDLRELGLDRPVDLDQALLRVVGEVTRRLKADRCTLYLVDHARQELVSRVGILPELSEIRLRMGEGVAGLVASEGTSIRVPGTRHDPRVLRRIDLRTGYQTRNLLAVPVRRGRSVIAVLQLLNKEGGEFEQEDETLAARLAEQVATLLEATSLGSQLGPDQRQPLSFRYNQIVGESAAMQQAYDRIGRAARADVTVLLRGESGCGKELAARAIHDNSPRASGPFVKVDCAALPEGLVENELFGHERGAYTGAGRAVTGKVAAAEGGTLFLDEIGELPLVVQGKLLRLLQERSFMRVGGTVAQKVDLRFVCATHRDLETDVQQGRFRQDLYYRVRVVQLRLPPLRERGGGDLDRLIDHFLYTFCRKHRRSGLSLDLRARALLHSHSWPGNVRELENCIEAAVVLSPTAHIGPEAFQFIGSDSGNLPISGEQGGFSCAVGTLKEVERKYVRYVLHLNGGNRSRTARLLGIGRNTLNRKLSESPAADPTE